jgi:hypothetical protein
MDKAVATTADAVWALLRELIEAQTEAERGIRKTDRQTKGLGKRIGDLEVITPSLWATLGRGETPSARRVDRAGARSRRSCGNGFATSCASIATNGGTASWRRWL